MQLTFSRRWADQTPHDMSVIAHRCGLGKARGSRCCGRLPAAAGAASASGCPLIAEGCGASSPSLLLDSRIAGGRSAAAASWVGWARAAAPCSRRPFEVAWGPLQACERRTTRESPGCARAARKPAAV